MSSAYDRLRPHLQRLVDGYMLGVPGSDIVRQLRPHLKQPRVTACKWLARPDVKAAIAERKVAAVEQRALTQERWDEEIAKIAYANVRKSDIRPSDKNKALELAGRRLGLYKDSAGERTPIGPGLTVIVQQAVQVSGAAPKTVTSAQRVDARLPGPAGS